MDPKEEFRVYMKAASRGLGDDSAVHIGEEELIAYQQERLGGPERSRIQHHFMQCSSCFDKFKDVSDFFEPARRDEESLSEAMIAREWESFSKNLPLVSPEIVERRLSFGRFFFAPRAVALAATFIIILTTSWAIWLFNERSQLTRQLESQRSSSAEELRALDEENRRLRERDRLANENESRLQQLEMDKQKVERRATDLELEIARMKQPELNSPIYDIYAQGSAQRSTTGGARNSVAISRRAKTVTLILNGSDQPEHPQYAIEMVDPKGRVNWRREGLKRDSFGNFVVTLNRASLSEGEVVLRIYAGSELIARYNLSVRWHE